MKCPYNIKSETTCQMWNQKNDEEEETRMGGRTTTKVIYEYMDCKQHQCGAYYNGRCHYNEK